MSAYKTHKNFKSASHGFWGYDFFLQLQKCYTKHVLLHANFENSIFPIDIQSIKFCCDWSTESSAVLLSLLQWHKTAVRAQQYFLHTLHLSLSNMPPFHASLEWCSTYKILTILFVLRTVFISRLQAFIDFNRIFNRALYCKQKKPKLLQTQFHT